MKKGLAIVGVMVCVFAGCGVIEPPEPPTWEDAATFSLNLGFTATSLIWTACELQQAVQPGTWSPDEWAMLTADWTRYQTLYGVATEHIAAGNRAGFLLTTAQMATISARLAAEKQEHCPFKGDK